MSNDGRAQIVLSAVDQTAPAFEAANRNLEALGTSAKRVAQQHQIAAVQVKDFLEQILAGGSPVRAFAQQGAAVVSTYGGFSKTIKALTGLLTPARLAIGGAAAGVGFLGAAFFAGAAEAKAFADAVKLSGNFAGQTAGSFDGMAKSIADSSRLSIGAAKEFGQALIATGQVGPQNFKAATEAAARYGDATGKTADQVAQDFAQMGRDAVKWARDHNEALNFLTASQIKQIKTLQEQGRAADAQGVIYQALNERLRGMDNNLGTLDKTLNIVSKSWDAFWNSVKGAGKAETAQDVLDRLNKKVADLHAPPTRVSEAQATQEGATGAAFVGPSTGKRQSTIKAEVVETMQARLAASVRVLRQTEAAFADADRAATNKAGDAARARLDALLDETKTRGALSKALKENARDFKAAADAGVPYTKAEQKAIDDATRKKFANSDEEQTLRKNLDGRLESLKEGIDKERDLFAYANTQLADAFAAGEMSIDQFYDAKQKAQLDFLVAQQAGFDAEIKAWEEYRAKVAGTKPQEKQAATNAIAKLIAEQGKASRESGQAAEKDEKARVKGTEEYRKSLVNLDAQIKELSGDKFGAEQLRNAQQLLEAKKLLSQGGDDPTNAKRLADLTALLKRQAQYNDLQDKLSLLNERQAVAEEAYLVTARARGDGLLKQEAEIQAMRQKSVGQLQEIYDAQQKIADSSTDPRMKLWAAQLGLALAKAKENLDPTLARVRSATDEFGNAIGDAVADVVINFHSLDDVFKGLMKTLDRLVVQTLLIDPLKESAKGFLKGFAPSITDFIKGGGAAPTGTAAAGAAVSAATSASTTAGTATADAGLAALGSSAFTADASLLALADSAANAATSLAAVGAAGSLGGGGGGGVSADDAESILAMFAHTGGVAGEGGNFRNVPAAAFAGALHYRTGGIAGFAPDEVPAVLHRGEEVLTQGDPRHRDNGGMQPGKVIHLSVNVSAAPGMTKQTATQQGAAAGRAARAALARND